RPYRLPGDLPHLPPFPTRRSSDLGLRPACLSEEVVRDISSLKDEPEWMLERRLKALKLFDRKPLPTWGPDVSGIAFEDIKYFVRDRKSTRLNSSHVSISYAVFCLK